MKRIALSAGLLVGCLGLWVFSQTPEHSNTQTPKHPNTQTPKHPNTQTPKHPNTLHDPREVHLQNLRQLTFGGENAEAYFSPTGSFLIFQSTRDNFKADQIFIMDIEGKNVRLVSTGKGRCTCGYVVADISDGRIEGPLLLFSSTHWADPNPPPPPDRSQGYVWAVYRTYEIFVFDMGSGKVKRLTHNKAYDAEATVCWKTRKIIFTSDRDGDLELYTMDVEGKNVKRITNELGYDGGAFFSPDGKKIVWRASRPKTPEEIADYKRLLSQGLVRPNKLEIFVADAYGKNMRQITNNGAANFAPSWHPDGKRIIFTSNLHNKEARRPDFDLYLFNEDGTGLERITYHPDFDGFPMFSPDGKKLVWSSNRGAKVRGETNIFIADWND